MYLCFFFFFKQKTAYEMRISDWSSDVCSSDLVTWSTNLIVALAERGAIMLLCGSNHAPVAVCLPLDGHHAQNGRIRAQWEAGKPLAKQLWRRIIVAKIRWQAAVLEANGQSASAFDLLARSEEHTSELQSL